MSYVGSYPKDLLCSLPVFNEFQKTPGVWKESYLISYGWLGSILKFEQYLLLQNYHFFSCLLYLIAFVLWIAFRNYVHLRHSLLLLVLDFVFGLLTPCLNAEFAFLGFVGLLLNIGYLLDYCLDFD